MTDINVVAAFNSIYDATNNAVLSFVMAKCGNTADIQDIVQETYVELYRVLEKRGADYIQNEKAFCLRIAKHKVHRHYSLVERLRMFVPPTLTDEDGEDLDYIEIESEFMTDVFAIDRIMVEEAKAFIRQKPQDVQKVFYLYYSLGNTIPEIAQLLDLGESNVKQKLYRTLKELRELLQ